MKPVNIPSLEIFPEFSKSGKAELLKKEVIRHIENDMPRLIQLMYRLDIQEKDFLSAFESKKTEEIATTICNLILHRIQKILESRKAFKQDAENTSNRFEHTDDW